MAVPTSISPFISSSFSEHMLWYCQWFNSLHSYKLRGDTFSNNCLVWWKPLDKWTSEVSKKHIYHLFLLSHLTYVTEKYYWSYWSAMYLANKLKRKYFQLRYEILPQNKLPQKELGALLVTATQYSVFFFTLLKINPIFFIHTVSEDTIGFYFYPFKYRVPMSVPDLKTL